MHEPVEIIVTPRLRLRSPAPSDLQILHDHVLSDAAVMQLALSGQPMSPLQSREFIDRNFDHDASGKKLGVLIERATEQVIGFAGLPPCDVLVKLALFCVVLLGVGYATEIGR
jgi:[ribosomal protein S5]-alanine N-acetyltransferase